ncbi:hypothetical protein UFOVP815_33 [uncultured Caudovirales phage]|uniref:Uncharacterized protein n=1 Tax=uncultured Caudovirales phage TaxID=2100421 RepID=A0A6J5P0H2_9CAUD|nr:hypothetical protein UFOVP815_33 [uncultured Caudovirales phage]
MNKLASALGNAYTDKRRAIRTRTFELGGHTFKVRVPLVSESDAMFARVSEPKPELVEKLYEALTISLAKFKDQQSEEFQFIDNDIIVSGRSMREAAKNKAMMELRITEYVQLLVPEDPEQSLADITYADIEAEWPLSVQIALVDKIVEVTSPGYKETRGN